MFFRADLGKTALEVLLGLGVPRLYQGTVGAQRSAGWLGMSSHPTIEPLALLTVASPYLLLTFEIPRTWKDKGFTRSTRHL